MKMENKQSRLSESKMIIWLHEEDCESFEIVDMNLCKCGKPKPVNQKQCDDCISWFHGLGIKR